MATKLTKKIPDDFPNTLPDLVEVNGVPIRTDLLVDVLVGDEGLTYDQAHNVIACILAPEWGEE